MSLDYRRQETRDVGAVHVCFDRDLVAWSGKRKYSRCGPRRESGSCGVLERRFLGRRVDPGLKRQNGRLWRSANEAFGMSPMSFDYDPVVSGGELFGPAIVNVSRCHKADSRVPVVKIVVQPRIGKGAQKQKRCIPPSLDPGEGVTLERRAVEEDPESDSQIPGDVDPSQIVVGVIGPLTRNLRGYLLSLGFVGIRTEESMLEGWYGPR